MFQGAVQLNLDNKGRLAIPARYRDMLLAHCAGQLVLTADADGCLLLYPQPEWQPRPEPIQRTQPTMTPQQMEMPTMPPMQSPVPNPDFGMDMPSMEPAPPPDLPDLGFPDESLDFGEEPKKKGIFGMFKK